MDSQIMCLLPERHIGAWSLDTCYKSTTVLIANGLNLPKKTWSTSAQKSRKFVGMYAHINTTMLEHVALL